MNKKPVVAVTMGDPAGIGPEIILKALGRTEVYARCIPIVVGSAAMLRYAADMLGIPATLHSLQSVGEAAAGVPGTINILDVPLDKELVQIGVEGAEGGRAAVACVQRAVALALAGEVDALATAPLNKAAIALAGFPYAGHTELIADLTGTRDYAMMLVSGALRVIHVSTHVSLRQAIEQVRVERIVTVVQIADRALCRLFGAGKEKRLPRIAVAGLNPHAGEGGLFGQEEREIIAPAVARAREAGCDAHGPFPPDTIFYRASRGEFDIVVAMYHDQGHIPAKLLGFESGVNVSLGMPIVRTSVDHGTAFDIAYKGFASEQSMVEAILLAAQMAAGVSGEGAPVNTL